MTGDAERKVIIEVETRVHGASGLAKITIPTHILRRIERYSETGIYKLSILDRGVELFFKYEPGEKVVIVSRFITHGRHRISITPYSVNDFIREFNERIRGKFDVRLHIEGETLILKVGGESLNTSKWRFYKEAGGGVAIQAEYTSSQRRNKRLLIKYQVKMGDAHIYLLEPQEGRRPSTQKIVGIEYNRKKGLILFRYRHGTKVKTTSADLHPKLRTEDQNEEDAELIWKGDSCEILIHSRLRRGRQYELILPWRIFKALRKRFKTDIYKLVIEGRDITTEYIWKLNRKGEQEISLKGLSEGIYKVSIKPYTIENFIHEFNVGARSRYGIELKIEEGVLTLYIGGKVLKTVKWNFDKEFGGGAFIKAIYPSITRANKEVTIKYQVKKGEAKIWILEPRNNRRPAVYSIQCMTADEDGIEITYKHGRRMKTTYIPLLT